MNIRVNGSTLQINGPTTILGFLEERQIDVRSVAVAKNGSLVHRSRLSQEPLEAGDELEIVRVVPGG